MSRLVRSGGQPRAMAGRAWVFTVVRGPGGGAAVCTAGEARGRTGQSPVSGAFLASANGDVKTSQTCKSGAAAGRLGDGWGVHVRAHWSVDAGEVHANSQIAVPLGTGVIDA